MIEIIAGVIVLILAIIAIAKIATRRPSEPSEPRRVNLQEATKAVSLSHLYNERFTENLEARLADADSPIYDAAMLIKQFKPGKRQVMTEAHLKYLLGVADAAKREAYRTSKINGIMKDVYSILREYGAGRMERGYAEHVVGNKLKELKYALKAAAGPEKA
jgi:hypothetical protein